MPADTPVRIGNLYGNRFTITIRNIDKNIQKRNIIPMLDCLKEYSGFPNFFGVQRFGMIRPINHLIGRSLIDGDYETAVMTYLARPFSGETQELYNLRKELESTRNFARALQGFPDHLIFEKSILNSLVHEPNDYINALQQLPRNLLTLFINAYQSYLFNKMVSKRIIQEIPLNQAIIGDIVLPLRQQMVQNEPILVTRMNIDKVNLQVSKKKAFISGLLIGCDPLFSEGEMGEIEHQIIEEENINYLDFTIPEVPFLSSSGTRRSLLSPLDTMNWELVVDSLKEEKKALVLQFELLKGCYATVLLREIMKTVDITDY